MKSRIGRAKKVLDEKRTKQAEEAVAAEIPGKTLVRKYVPTASPSNGNDFKRDVYMAFKMQYVRKTARMQTTPATAKAKSDSSSLSQTAKQLTTELEAEAEQLYKQGQHFASEARKSLRKIDGNSTEANDNTAEKERKAALFVKAVEFWEEALAFNPSHMLAQFSLALCLKDGLGIEADPGRYLSLLKASSSLGYAPAGD